MRQLLLVLVCGLLALPHPTWAQEITPISSLQQSRNEERFALLESKVTQLLEDQRVLFERMSRIDRSLENAASEIRGLKLKLDSQPANVVTRDQLEKVVKQLDEVEKNRAKDKQVMLEMLAKIKELVLAPEPASERRPTPSGTPAAPAKNYDELVEYTVERDQTISAIVKAYNESEEFRENGWTQIGYADIRAVNPGIDINKVFPGQKILIPIIKKKP